MTDSEKRAEEYARTHYPNDAALRLLAKHAYLTGARDVWQRVAEDGLETDAMRSENQRLRHGLEEIALGADHEVKLPPDSDALSGYCRAATAARETLGVQE